MDNSRRDEAQSQGWSPGRDLLNRAMLAALGGGLLWLAWAGYSQAGLLMQLVNLSYCG